MPSREFLRELADPQKPLSSSRLLNLSGLSPEEVQATGLVWTTIAPDRRQLIMERLVEIAEDTVEADFQAMFRLCLDDSEAPLRARGIEGLSECQEPWFLDRLMTMMQEDPEESVRAVAATALGRFSLMAELEQIRRERSARLWETLVRVVQNPTESLEVRRRAIEAVSPFSHPEIDDILRSAYFSDEPKLQASALYAMGRHCDPAWLPILLKELKNEDPELRFEAARACGELEDRRAVPHLASLLQDQDPQVQLTVIEALGHIGGSEAKEYLLGCLRSPRTAVREAAQEALEEIETADEPLSYP